MRAGYFTLPFIPSPQGRGTKNGRTSPDQSTATIADDSVTSAVGTKNGKTSPDQSTATIADGSVASAVGTKNGRTSPDQSTATIADDSVTSAVGTKNGKTSPDQSTATIADGSVTSAVGTKNGKISFNQNTATIADDSVTSAVGTKNGRTSPDQSRRLKQGRGIFAPSPLRGEGWGEGVRYCFLLLILLCAFLPSCASAPVAEQPGRPTDYPLAQVSLFLNSPKNIVRDITWHIDSISLIDDKGAALPLLEAGLQLRSTALRSGQLRLSEKEAPEGRYVGLLISAKRATINSGNGGKSGTTASDLSMDNQETMVPFSITVSNNQAVAIFLTWEPDSSIVDGFFFRPLVHARTQEPGITSLMMYVTNQDSHNVYVISRQSNEVEATVLVGRGPRGIAVNTMSEDRKVFVANTEGNSVSVIDARRNTVETEMPLRFGREPVAIAVARLSPVREDIYVANYRSNNVSVLDGRTYQEVESVEVGNGPIAIAVDPPQETELNMTLPAQDIDTLRNYRQRFMNVYVANRNDRSISVLRVSTAAGSIESVLTVPVEWTPVKLFVDYPNAVVYGVHRDCDCISVMNIARLIRGDIAGSVSYIRYVGRGGADLAVDRSTNRIYFLKESPPEVLVLRPLQATPAATGSQPSLLGVIEAGSLPGALAIDPEGRKLYLLDRGPESLTVIDRATREQVQVIPLGRRPHGICMFAD